MKLRRGTLMVGRHMRSPRGVAAALILLSGMLLALIAAVGFGNGAENIIHLSLAATFLLLAFAVFDFRLPRWINWAACATTGALAAIFLLQGASDLTQSASLRHLAYHVLGQRVEKVLGYAFLCWCVAMLFRDSTGKRQAFGVVVLVAIFSMEIYTAVTVYGGAETLGVLKLFYPPLFIWLLLEGKQHRHPCAIAPP
jgi:hypothetical protein